MSEQHLRGGHHHVFVAPPGSMELPTIARAEGIHMWDTEGRRYTDVSAGPVVSNLGHGNTRVLEAMIRQAQDVCFAWPTNFQNHANRMLADRLASLAGPGLDRAFMVSGGSEAVESCLKFARQYAVARGEASRYKVIGRHPSYHGATLGALGVTGDVDAEALFGPMMQLTPKVPAPLSYRYPNDFDAASYAAHCAEAIDQEIRRQGPESVLAVILEPVGGLATGALVAPDSYYRRVREICTHHGVLLIHDEVMSGAGRTGKFLASHHWPEARPDLVALAKGIGAGYTPLGIMLAPDAMVQQVVAAGGFAHGHTYNANPLTCAVGQAVLEETIARDLIANAARQGARLAQGLRALAQKQPLIGDVRGKGLLLALELVADPTTKAMLPRELPVLTRVTQIAREHGLVLYTRRTNRGVFGDWLMLTPPLIISDAEVDEIIAGLATTLEIYRRELLSQGVMIGGEVLC